MSDFNPKQLSVLASTFDIEGRVIDVSPFGSGHINDTYRVLTGGLAAKRYLLQRVNYHVFKNVPPVMQNIQVVTRHLKKRYASENNSGQPLEDRVLTLVLTSAGEAYHQDETHNFSRMFLLLHNTTSYDIVETTQHTRDGGRTSGTIQRQ